MDFGNFRTINNFNLTFHLHHAHIRAVTGTVQTMSPGITNFSNVPAHNLRCAFVFLCIYVCQFSKYFIYRYFCATNDPLTSMYNFHLTLLQVTYCKTQ